MQDWGRSFRFGRRYTRVTALLWAGSGWDGCANFSRHPWRRNC